MRDLARSLIALFLATGLLFAVPSPVSAELVSTSEALALEDEDRARAIIDAYLARDEVAAELVALGVDPELARLRVAALSSVELAELAGRVEEAPAGGDGLIAVLGITFVVLLILELVGVIDIFKKI